MKRRLLLVVCCAFLAGLMLPAVAQAKVSTRLYATVNTQWEHFDRVPQLTGTLKTSRGSVLKYKTVYLYYNGSKVASKRTNSQGKVVFNLYTGKGDMQGSWNLRYSGSSTYSSSTSVRRKTLQHFHYLAEYQVPLLEDTDGDGVDEYYLDIDLFLAGGSTYYISTSAGVYIWVLPYSQGIDLFPGEGQVTGGEFTVFDSDFHRIRMQCPNGDPVSVIIF